MKLAQPTLALIAMLAPLPALAFGNLDCIAIQSCTNSGCTPATDPFAVTFNWADETVTVETNDAAHTLAWAHTGQTDDGLASLLEYGDMDDTDRLLRIEASGMDITGYYSFKDPSVTTWTATCDVRTAA